MRTLTPLTRAVITLFATAMGTWVCGADVQRMEPPLYRPVPVRVAGITTPVLSLCGTWTFCSEPPETFFSLPSVAVPNCADIDVPSEWVMQGFSVPAGKAAGYRRTFTRPEDWNGARVILRADAVYSDCTVWVNGTLVGEHLGGFTPVELDITAMVQPGTNTIALSVKNESVADALASGSQYAVHPLGGITRKIRLFAVPPVHASMMHVVTDLDLAYRDAMVTVQAAFRNDADADVTATCTVDLLGPWLLGKALRPDVDTPVISRKETVVLKKGETLERTFTLSLPGAALWHNEHPNLYRARLTLLSGATELEMVERAFGCKKVEVRGNEVFVNGAVQKIFGVCRHEAHPLRGRSLTGDLWRKDVQLYRDANVNLLRTSHYCAAEELFDAADELGIFIESEGPFCWAHKAKGPAELLREATVRQTLEMGQFYRSHASILFWSLGNESRWNAYFNEASQALRTLDPSRPQTFENFPCDGMKVPELQIVDIITTHYPGPGGPNKYRNAPKPVNFGEYCHLNAYNRFELSTDPGLRDAWGRRMTDMVDQMRASKGVFGGSFWAAMDDTFFVPPPRNNPAEPVKVVGYGTWGPLDGWRRPKPEYWHMKKAYAPIRVLTRDLLLPAGGGDVTVQVANRFVFTHLKELQVTWQAGAHKGIVQADVAPGQSGSFTLQLPPLAPGIDLDLVFTSPLGFMVDRSTIGSTPATVPALATGPTKVTAADDFITVETGTGATMAINRTTGLIASARIAGKSIAIGGPHLLLLPLNDGGETQMKGKDPVYPIASAPCSEWKPNGPATLQADTVTVEGAYSEAKGSFSYRLAKDGCLEIAYDFTCLSNVNPRQVGIVLDLPRTYETLSWKRKGFWTAYPEDHIGRTKGTASAFPAGVETCSQVGPKSEPSWPWKDDTMAYGSNDFRSTKENILYASLRASDGPGAIDVVSDGSQHVRAWVDGGSVHLLIASYANAGFEKFFKSHAQQDYKPLKKGDRVTGTARIRLSVGQDRTR